jgi:hypothetical protein
MTLTLLLLIITLFCVPAILIARHQDRRRRFDAAIDEAIRIANGGRDV